MFERFTKDARRAVETAQQYAAEVHAVEVREEHLALGVVTATDSPAVSALELAGATAEVRARLQAELIALCRRAGVTDADADALRELGIDVDEVLDRLEELAQVPAGWPATRLRDRLFRRRVSDGTVLPAVPWSDNAKGVLERALREAVDRRDAHIDDGHVLVALLNGDGVVAETMARHDITYTVVRRALAQRN